SAFEISEHFEYHGAYLNRSCHNETAEISLHCLTKHITSLLPVVGEIISDSVYPEKELAIYKQNAKQKLSVNLQKCEFVAARLIDAHLFGEQHPYGKYSNIEDYEALQREDIVTFYNQRYRYGSCVIFVAGKLPDDLLDRFEEEFGKIPLRSHRITGEPIRYHYQPSAEKKHLVMNDAQGVQAAIRIARDFPNRKHPDFQKAMVLNNVYGGYFGSRLMANIREDKGYTYGIYSYLMNHVSESGWMISTEAGRDVSDATIAEVYAEMEGLRDEIIDEEELLITKNYMIGTILGDLDGAFQVAARWKNLILNDLDENYFYDAIRVIKTVSADELQAIAKKYLLPEEFYEMVVI
ncbi:MAG: pitrilysin family protein, partial [Flavitalea sp.]